MKNVTVGQTVVARRTITDSLLDVDGQDFGIEAVFAKKGRKGTVLHAERFAFDGGVSLVVQFEGAPHAVTCDLRDVG